MIVLLVLAALIFAFASLPLWVPACLGVVALWILWRQAVS